MRRAATAPRNETARRSFARTAGFELPISLIHRFFRLHRRGGNLIFNDKFPRCRPLRHPHPAGFTHRLAFRRGGKSQIANDNRRVKRTTLARGKGQLIAGSDRSHIQYQQLERGRRGPNRRRYPRISQRQTCPWPKPIRAATRSRDRGSTSRRLRSAVSRPKRHLASQKPLPKRSCWRIADEQSPHPSPQLALPLGRPHGPNTGPTWFALHRDECRALPHAQAVLDSREQFIAGPREISLLIRHQFFAGPRPMKLIDFPQRRNCPGGGICLAAVHWPRCHLLRRRPPAESNRWPEVEFGLGKLEFRIVVLY